MNWLDITILAIIAVFALVGISRGLISQVFSVLALAGGLAAGLLFYDTLGRALTVRGAIDNESLSNVISFIVLVLIFYIIIQLLGWLLTKLIGTLRLGFLNRISGGVLGAVFGVIAVFFLVSSLSFFYSEKDPVFGDSALLPYLNEGSSLVKASLPEDFGKSVDRARELVREEGFKTAMRIKDSDALREILGSGLPAPEEPR